MSKRNVWCPTGICTPYYAPEQLCSVCLHVYQCIMERTRERDAALLQNRDLKAAIWRHLHIKTERMLCPLSVGTPERCCEIIMRDAGLNPVNGEFIEKRKAEMCGEQYGAIFCAKEKGHPMPHEGMEPVKASSICWGS